MFNSERLFLILGELIGVDYLYNQNGRALQDYESFIKTWEDGSEVDVEGIQLHMDEIEAKDMPMPPLAEVFTPNPAEIIQHQMEKHVQLRSKPVQPVLMDNKPLSKPMEQEVYPTTNLVLPGFLAQSVEHETLNLGVVGSSPTLGVFLLILIITKCYLDNGSHFGS